MLYLWMPEANGVWQWSEGDFWKQSSTLEQLIQEIQPHAGKDAVVFFPSRDVQIIQQNFPKAQYKKLGPDGVKYLLEEYVILPLDSMKVLHHFENPDHLTVMGIANSAVETMQHALTLIPVKVISLLPDFLVLPNPEDNQYVLANVTGHLLVRNGEYWGQSVDDLALFLDYQTEQPKYKISNLSADQTHCLESAIIRDQIESFYYELPQIKKPKQHPLNVLPKAKSNSGVSGYWKACAAVLVAALIIQFSYDAVRWYQYKKVANITANQAIDQFKYWFGQNYPVTEQTLRSQFEAQLRQSQTGNAQALSLLSRIGPVLMQNQIVANRVSYDASMLNMELKANSAEVLQNLMNQLKQQGFKAELGNIQPGANGAIGLVKVQ
ncbi:general secretion pathway protein GspL [Acinetobacter sp. ANC 5054]|uniref:type II secretion system protein GspL n=1 Tax=Acinetobacter sp. ANC 5054 TaxID=1977877 RepID=UPI000A351144|nr:type II secretion system protein GspL [Acinetobacter sp. ANC 5054]OTG82793.1 general secretion pathway protein GspL [Acinetobacter sp. ANC 5054]